jgi:hypothetical protein
MSICFVSAEPHRAEHTSIHREQEMDADHHIRDSKLCTNARMVPSTLFCCIHATPDQAVDPYCYQRLLDIPSHPLPQASTTALPVPKADSEGLTSKADIRDTIYILTWSNAMHRDMLDREVTTGDAPAFQNSHTSLYMYMRIHVKEALDPLIDIGHEDYLCENTISAPQPHGSNNHRNLKHYLFRRALCHLHMRETIIIALIVKRRI